MIDPDFRESDRSFSQHMWTHSLFWGIIPLGRANLGVCGEGGVKKVTSQIGGLGLIAYALTGGIWAPMHVKVVCAAPPQAPPASPGQP